MMPLSLLWWWSKVIFMSKPTYELSCGWVGVVAIYYSIIIRNLTVLNVHQDTVPSFIILRFFGLILPLVPSDMLSQITVLNGNPWLLSVPTPFMYSSYVLVWIVGGGFLIFLPLVPSFLCHKPLRGRIPNHRIRLGDPIGRAFRGWILTVPTTHWASMGIANSNLSQHLITTRSPTFRRTFAFSSAFFANQAPSPGHLSTWGELLCGWMYYTVRYCTWHTVVPRGRAPSGWLSPSTGLIGFSGIVENVLMISPSFILSVATCHLSLSCHPVIMIMALRMGS